MSGFGKRRSSRVSVLEPNQAPLGPSVELTRKRNDALIDRDNGIAIKIPNIHNSHLERFWPRYGGIAAMLFAAIFYINEGNSDPFSIAFPSVLFGLFAFLTLRTFRNSLNALYKIRKLGKRTKAFYYGMAVGFGYWIYSTFFNPTIILGQEMGPQTVFYDGFQRQDLGAAAILIMKASVVVFLSGAVFEFINKRIATTLR